MKKSHVFFWLYCAVMLWLLFGQRMGMEWPEDYKTQLLQNLNLRPFDTVGRFWWVLRYSDQPGMVTHAFSNLAGNVVLFVPLGLCLPGLWRRLEAFGFFFLAVTVLIAAVELLQLVTLLGSCDVDDLLLNLVGACSGFGMRRLWLFFSKSRGASPK